MFRELTKKMDHFLEMGIPGYDCIVYHRGACVYRHWNGYESIAERRPLQGNERYNIYSCSKPITCTAALQLYEAGKFQLDDPLWKYMPEFKNMAVQTEHGIQKAENTIRVRDLFCMSAGLSYALHSPMLELARRETNGKCPTRETMRYLAQEPLCFEPGTQYQYSLCHDVLAALVEILAEERFGAYVKRRIFDPLGMEHTTFLLPDEELDTIATQYRFNGETGKAEDYGKQIPYKMGSEYESGGAGCVSTVEDYIRFLEAMRKGDVILKKETIGLMATHQLNESEMRTYDGSETPPYGYGLGVRCPIAGSTETDFGWGGAAGAYLAIDPAYEMTVFYVQHMLNSPNQSIRGTIRHPIRAALRR